MRSTKQSKPVAVTPQADAAKEPNEVNEPVDQLADSFYYDTDNYQQDLEKAIRSVAYILEWQGEVAPHGEIPGYVATGIAKLLRDCAMESRKLLSVDEFVPHFVGHTAAFSRDHLSELSRAIDTELVRRELIARGTSQPIRSVKSPTPRS